MHVKSSNSSEREKIVIYESYKLMLIAAIFSTTSSKTLALKKSWSTNSNKTKQNTYKINQKKFETTCLSETKDN